MLYLKQNQSIEISDRRLYSLVDMSTQLLWYHMSHSLHAIPISLQDTCCSQCPHGKMSHNLGSGLTCISPAISSTIKVTSLAGLSELREVWDLGTSKSLLAVHRPSMRMCCTWSVIDAETGVPGTMVSEAAGLCATAHRSHSNQNNKKNLVASRFHRILQQRENSPITQSTLTQAGAPLHSHWLATRRVTGRRPRCIH